MYSNNLVELNLDRTRIFSPHKPILLLAIIELFEQGLIRQNQIHLSPDLIATFLKYWNQFGSNWQKPDFALTFLGMNDEGFWHLKAQPGLESFLSSVLELKTISALKNVVQYAYLDRPIFCSLREKASRVRLLYNLVDEWFHKKSDRVYKLFNINAFRDFQEELRKQGGIVYKPEILQNEEKFIVRDAAFRQLVSSSYHYQCAFCGLQVLASRSESLVDGVHIKPFSLFYDDRIDNGISLCKNHRWAFEQGGFTVNDNYEIIISNDLWVESYYVKSMKEFHGQRILLPAQEQHFPRLEALRWHRENVFNQFTG